MSAPQKVQVSSSKSLYNRALIVQSYFPAFKILGESAAEDVIDLQQALMQLKNGESQFKIGAGGTTLRFLALRLSRLPGKFTIHCDSRLLERPQQEMIALLKQMQVEMSFLSSNKVLIEGDGWQKPKGFLPLDLSRSSQFASSVLLNAWHLPFDLTLALSNSRVSQSYFAMTLQFLQNLGLTLNETNSQLEWPAHTTLGQNQYQVEPDVSSAFAVAALALQRKGVLIKDFPCKSMQPDIQGFHFLQQMGVTLEKTEQGLEVQAPKSLQPLRADLTNCPDLAPVLSVFLARADGESVLTGLEHLAHKESHRLKKSMELLDRLGVSTHYRNKDWKIVGQKKFSAEPFHFDPDHDHRMAMAAEVANFAGAKIEILNKHVVQKSFPEFWKIAESLK